MTNTMRFFAFLYLFFSVVVVAAQPFTAEEIARWEAQAKEVTIIRDSWGIPTARPTPTWSSG